MSNTSSNFEMAGVLSGKMCVNVKHLRENLLAFCQKHKFKVLADFYPDTYIVNSEEIMALEILPLKQYEDYL